MTSLTELDYLNLASDGEVTGKSVLPINAVFPAKEVVVVKDKIYSFMGKAANKSDYDILMADIADDGRTITNVRPSGKAVPTQPSSEITLKAFVKDDYIYTVSTYRMNIWAGGGPTPFAIIHRYLVNSDGTLGNPEQVMVLGKASGSFFNLKNFDIFVNGTHIYIIGGLYSSTYLGTSTNYSKFVFVAPMVAPMDPYTQVNPPFVNLPSDFEEDALEVVAVKNNLLIFGKVLTTNNPNKGRLWRCSLMNGTNDYSPYYKGTYWSGKPVGQFRLPDIEPQDDVYSYIKHSD